MRTNTNQKNTVQPIEKSNTLAPAETGPADPAKKISQEERNEQKNTERVSLDRVAPEAQVVPASTPTRNKTIDPICGMELKERDPQKAAEIDGTMYYFCSDNCRKEFKRSVQITNERLSKR